MPFKGREKKMEDKLNMIISLMEDLKDKMQYGEDDLSERLGRKKPEVEVMKVEAEPEMAMESDESPEVADMEGGFEDEAAEESPEDKLKNRLMKLRA
jgi:hypothetical protein